jgi:hypothetical protein
MPVMKYVLILICLVMSFKSASAQKPIPDMRSTTKSNVEFLLSNNGIYGSNLITRRGGVFWPRGSGNQYIFGGGIWFGAKKMKEGEAKPRELTVVSFNPNSGISWMMPGQVSDTLKQFDSTQYLLQSSIDYHSNGTEKNGFPYNWPMWDTKGNVRTNRNFGSYITNQADRSGVIYPKGTVIISDEDIVAVYNDKNLGNYELSVNSARNLGYPLGIQFEQVLYSWEMGTLLQDAVAIRYTIINTSPDTLKECWVGNALDGDIVSNANNSNKGAQNDIVKYLSERADLNTAIQFSEETMGDEGKGLGVIAVSLLESPAIDVSHSLRKDKKSFTFTEQLGLKTFKNWTIDGEGFGDSRYYELSRGVIDGNTGAADKRMLLATGPFHMMPGDTTYLTVAFTFAKRDTANENYAKLIQKIEAVRDTLFKNGGREVPEPEPGRSVVIYHNSAEATLYLSLLKTENVKVELYNVLGQRVREVFNGELSAQNHAIPFSTAMLPSGAYYCAIFKNGDVEMVPVRIAR